ncbi:MAG: amidohydrolase family protein, partial [Peptococcaceae bacterium]|nr:amidohydrolase family protein [Peptococcaceae bacterium]
EQAVDRHLAASLKDTLHCGILALRDGGDRRNIGLRAARLAGCAAPPFILASGRALRKKGGYGSFLGMGLAAPEIAGAVREAAAAGAAQLKVLVSGIVSFREYGRVGPLQFSRAELSRLVREAHALGLKVMAHASSEEGAALAVECGVDSLEHGYFISRDTLARMAERGTAWVPTIIPVAAQSREPLRHNHPPSRLAVIEKTWRRQQLMVAAAHALGVAVGAGTDAGAAGVRHGQSYVEELKLLAGAGLPPAAVIRAATATGARILGLEKQLGTAAPGMPAYLIGVRGNPLADLGLLKNPAAAFIP